MITRSGKKITPQKHTKYSTNASIKTSKRPSTQKRSASKLVQCKLDQTEDSLRVPLTPETSIIRVQTFTPRSDQPTIKKDLTKVIEYARTKLFSSEQTGSEEDFTPMPVRY